jgi:hypothetical protein
VDSEAEQIDSSSEGGGRRRGAYNYDFEEVGLLGRERGAHGYGGAARRGVANPRWRGWGERVLEARGRRRVDCLKLWCGGL